MGMHQQALESCAWELADGHNFCGEGIEVYVSRQQK